MLLDNLAAFSIRCQRARQLRTTIEIRLEQFRDNTTISICAAKESDLSVSWLVYKDSGRARGLDHLMALEQRIEIGGVCANLLNFDTFELCQKLRSNQYLCPFHRGKR